VSPIFETLNTPLVWSYLDRGCSVAWKAWKSVFSRNSVPDPAEVAHDTLTAAHSPLVYDGDGNVGVFTVRYGKLLYHSWKW